MLLFYCILLGVAFERRLQQHWWCPVQNKNQTQGWSRCEMRKPSSGPFGIMYHTLFKVLITLERIQGRRQSRGPGNLSPPDDNSRGGTCVMGLLWNCGLCPRPATCPGEVVDFGPFQLAAQQYLPVPRPSHVAGSRARVSGAARRSQVDEKDPVPQTAGGHALTTQVRTQRLAAIAVTPPARVTSRG